MNAAMILAVLDGALTVLETLWPKFAEMAKGGEITVEQQQALKARVDALRPGGVAFTGPEWKPSGK